MIDFLLFYGIEDTNRHGGLMLAIVGALIVAFHVLVGVS